MSNIYSGELQDYEGNTIYPHTESDVVWLKDGTPLSKILDDISDAEIDAEIDFILSN